MTSKRAERRGRSGKRFAVQRIIADGDLWVTEYVLGYEGGTGAARLSMIVG